MLRVFLGASVALLLAGCATQFGTRMVPPAHHAIQQAPVIVQPSSPAPVPPETFKQRWLHKFFVKRATEK